MYFILFILVLLGYGYYREIKSVEFSFNLLTEYQEIGYDATKIVQQSLRRIVQETIFITVLAILAIAGVLIFS